jgi:hypothetical protein
MAGAESRVLEIFASLSSLGGLSHEELSVLSTVSPEVAEAFVRATFRDLKNNPLAPGLVQEVCARSISSEFSLTEWFRQVVRMYSWLHERRSTARFSDVLEYVSCAFEGSSLQPGHNLDWYLTHYGFERSAPLAQS